MVSASARPPRPARQGLRAPATGHTRKDPGPRVRPRHPPDRPRDSAATARAAPPSAPALPPLSSPGVLQLTEVRELPGSPGGSCHCATLRAEPGFGCNSGFEPYNGGRDVGLRNLVD